jgi:RalA-binding protein 1
LTYSQIGRQQTNANSETDKDNENSYRHAFLIMEPKPSSKSNTKHVLCAESDAERDEWVESLLQYVGISASEEEAPESKKHSKKKFSKDSIAKVNAQPISQLGKNDLNTKLIATDSVIQAQKADKKKGNTDSTIVRGESVSYSSHHPSSSLSSSPSSSMLSSSMQSTNSLLQQSDQWNDQSKNQQQSALGVSPNLIVKRNSMLTNREDSDRKVRAGTPEPRDNTASPVFGASANNQSQQTPHVQRRPHDDSISHEKRKGSRKTFFGSMFGSKEEKKKYQEARPDTTRIVFGVPLDQAIAVARIKEGYELPAVVYRCIEYLDAKNATEEEGIYRLSGATATIKFLKERFNSEGDVDLLGEGEYYDVHAVAGLLKLYLRELPTSVLTRDLHAEFVNVIGK